MTVEGGVLSAYTKAYCPTCQQTVQVHAETGRCQVCGKQVPGGRDPRVPTNGAASAGVVQLPATASTQRWAAETRTLVEKLTEQQTRAKERLEAAQREYEQVTRALSAMRSLLQQVAVPEGTGSRKNGRWALKYNACQRCGRDDRPHKSKGYCIGCDTAARKKAAA